MNPKQQSLATPWALIVIYIIISAVTISGGIVYYKIQKETLLANSIQELSTIADLKIRQITEWRRERSSDGQFLSQNPSMSRQFLEYLNKER